MYTGSFQFAQLEQSPHVRTAGRAFYHGSWGRPDPPKDASAGDSDSSSASSEGSGGTAGGGPELEGGSSGEDREEEMEGANFGLDGTGRDDEERVTVAGQKKKESKRRLAWGWPKRKEGEEEKRKRKRKRGNSYRGGDYVDDPGKRKSPAGGFGDSSDDDADGTGRQGYLQERNNKDRDQRKIKEEKKRRERKKNKKPRAQEKSKPHGEGYVEFLDGWGVSQVGAYRKLICLLG